MTTTDLVRDALTRDADRYRRLAEGLAEAMDPASLDPESTSTLVDMLQRAHRLQTLADNAANLGDVTALEARAAEAEARLGHALDELERTKADLNACEAALHAQPPRFMPPAPIFTTTPHPGLFAGDGSAPTEVIHGAMDDLSNAARAAHLKEAREAAVMDGILDDVARRVRLQDATAAADDDSDRDATDTAAVVTAARRAEDATAALARQATLLGQEAAQ